MVAEKKKRKTKSKTKTPRKKTKKSTPVTKAEVASKEVPGPLTNLENLFPAIPKPTEGFLIGNGESRLGFDLNILKGKGPIFGCNALYRDFEPDVLCAFDQGILLELMNTEYKGIIGKLNKTHTNALLDGVLLESLEVPRGKGIAWYSGIFAAWLLCSTASLMGWDIKRVFMLGYDLYDAKNNNIYKGSLNYEKMGINERIQFENFQKLVFAKFPDIIFLRVVDNPLESSLPDEWILMENIRNISYTDLKEYL